MSDDTPPETRSKVGRLIAEHELGDAGDRLEQRWTATAGERWSLRDLATWFNKQLLAAVLRDQDQQPIDETVETTYRLLTDDDVSAGARTQTRRDLERQGIDVDSLLADFVSHQAIHTYLTTYRDASPPPDDSASQAETAQRAINRLQSKTAAVTESNVNRLAATEKIDIGEVDVYVNVEVLCTECGQSYSIEELLAQDGCECPDEAKNHPDGR